MRTDVVVIGAGIGGLTVGSLLARAGRNVLVLEASEGVGGLAGSTNVEGFVFPRAATAISGLEPDMPVGLLLEDLGVSAPVLELHGETCLRLHGKAFPLDPEDSNPEAGLLNPEFSGDRVAEALHPGLADFLIHASEFWSKAWEAVLNSPHSRGAWLDPLTLAQGPHAREIERALLQSAAERYSGSEEGLAILSGLLQCIAGASAEEISFLQACLALERLWRPLYVPMGNLTTFCDKLAQFIEHEGGEVRTKTVVEAVRVIDDPESEFRFEVLVDGASIQTDIVVMNLCPVDAANLVDGRTKSFFEDIDRGMPQPSSVCSLYLAVDDVFHPDERMFHYCLLPPTDILGCAQVMHLTLLPLELEDYSQQPKVRQLLAHIPVDPAKWIGLSAEEIRSRRGLLRYELMRVLKQTFPQIEDARVIASRLQLPEDWSAELRRVSGGLIRLPWKGGSTGRGWPTGLTPVPGLVFVGATTFPGMSIAGAVQSGRRVARLLLD